MLVILDSSVSTLGTLTSSLVGCLDVLDICFIVDASPAVRDKRKEKKEVISHQVSSSWFLDGR